MVDPWAPPPAGSVVRPSMQLLAYASTCEVCGLRPALRGTARAHRGLIVVMTFRRRSGTFCRDCGTAITRALSADTLWQGWWGVLSLVVTPVVLIGNALLLRRYATLPRPDSPPTEAHGQPSGQPSSRPAVWAPTLDPGPSLWRRPVIAGLLAPGAAVSALLVTSPLPRLGTATGTTTQAAADLGDPATGTGGTAQSVAEQSAGQFAEQPAEPTPTATGPRELRPIASPGSCWVISESGPVELVDCREPHQVQIYAVTNATSVAEYRASGRRPVPVARQAKEFCDGAFEVIEWSEDAPAEVSTDVLHPSAAELAAADQRAAAHNTEPGDEISPVRRQIVCLVGPVDSDTVSVSYLYAFTKGSMI